MLIPEKGNKIETKQLLMRVLGMNGSSRIFDIFAETVFCRFFFSDQ